jgi:hypothetical protein
MWSRFPSSGRIPAADSVNHRKGLTGTPHRRPSGEGNGECFTVTPDEKTPEPHFQPPPSPGPSEECQCRRMHRMVFVTAVMDHAEEICWQHRVTCPKCKQPTHELQLIHAKILDEDACRRYPDCYCRKTACLLVALETYPDDYLICLDLDVVLDDALIGNICASPLHQTPAWFSLCAPERPVEPHFLNAMILYFFTFLQVITVQLTYTNTPILVGKFMILHAPFFHDCFTLRQLERIWGRTISEDYRLAKILKDQCGRTTQIVEWPVYTRPSSSPATLELVWSKTRRWMQGSYPSTVCRFLLWALMHKPLLVLPLWFYELLSPAAALVLYAALFMLETLSVMLNAKSRTLLRLLQVFLCTAAWELILPFIYVAWNLVDRFTWYRRTYVMSRFDDEMLYVMDEVKPTPTDVVNQAEGPATDVPLSPS